MFAERVQTRYADKRFSRPEFVIRNVRKKGEDEVSISPTIFWAAFTHTYPKSAKKLLDLTVFLRFYDLGA